MGTCELPRNLRFFLSQFQASNGEPRFSFFPFAHPAPAKLPVWTGVQKGDFCGLGAFPFLTPVWGGIPFSSCPAWGGIPPGLRSGGLPLTLPQQGEAPPASCLPGEASPSRPLHGGASPCSTPARGGIPLSLPARGGIPPDPFVRGGIPLPRTGRHPPVCPCSGEASPPPLPGTQKENTHPNTQPILHHAGVLSAGIKMRISVIGARSSEPQAPFNRHPHFGMQGFC